jgi:hypothetical protein
LTIAKILSRMIDATVVDNHWINDPILRLVAKDGSAAVPDSVWPQVAKVRGAVLETIATLAPRGASFIFTYAGSDEDPEDRTTFEEYRDVAVRLLCSEELVKRIQSSERHGRMLEWRITFRTGCAGRVKRRVDRGRRNDRRSDRFNDKPKMPRASGEARWAWSRYKHVMQNLINRSVMSTSYLTLRLPAVRKALHVVLGGLLLACGVATGALAREHGDDDGDWHHDNGKHKGWYKHHHEQDEDYERPVIVTPPPAVVIVPPPPVYAPAPIFAVPPQINVVIPIR